MQYFFNCCHFIKVRALKKFEDFCQRVKNGVENQTEGFLSALEIMLKNLERKGNTDEQIISGLNFFGIVSGNFILTWNKLKFNMHIWFLKKVLFIM